MDINCTLPCLHQIDGKCALVVVPDFIVHRNEGFYEACDCAYFHSMLL